VLCSYLLRSFRDILYTCFTEGKHTGSGETKCVQGHKDDWSGAPLNLSQSGLFSLSLFFNWSIVDVPLLPGTQHRGASGLFLGRLPLALSASPVSCPQRHSEHMPHKDRNFHVSRHCWLYPQCLPWCVARAWCFINIYWEMTRLRVWGDFWLQHHFSSRWEGGLPLRGLGMNPNIPEGRSLWLGNRKTESGRDLCQPRGWRSCETLLVVMCWSHVCGPVVQCLIPGSDKN